MSNNYFPPDDPTQPIQSHTPRHPDQQGKLVIGSFEDQNRQAPRRPYQYQSDQTQQSHVPEPHYPQRGKVPPQTPQPQYPQRQQTPTPQQTHRSSPQQHTHHSSASGEAPTIYPNHPSYPQRQAQPGSVGTPPRTPQKRARRKGRAGRIGCLATLAILIILGVLTFNTSQRALAFGKAISTQDPLSTQTGYIGGTDRTNLLVMGYGGGTHEGGNLTDSMVVVSMLPQNHHTSLVAVPRDLWVQNPPNSGQYSRLNAVYEVASQNGQQPVAGGDAAANKVSVITGMDVKYWLTIDFNGFRNLIDAIGGVDVYVPDSFTSQYPKNDDPKVDASWTLVSFTKGQQHMNGETAIEYARARHSEDNPAEGTDFARSARQQIIIKATLAKVKQWSTWPSLFNAMDALQKTIYTNLSLADLEQFATKMDLNDSHTARIGLSNANVLADDYAGGAQILTARNGNWQGIKDYVQKSLYN